MEVEEITDLGKTIALRKTLCSVCFAKDHNTSLLTVEHFPLLSASSAKI